MMPADLRPLARAELSEDTVELARSLLGATLVRMLDGQRLVGRIVETEAYLPDDAASHAFRGRTTRNASMFLERGHAYVYISYGCWPMLNVASEGAGTGAGVLIRALEPLEGVEVMRANRRGAQKLRDLARGPGRLAVAMGITLAQDGLDLCAPGALFLSAPLRAPEPIGTSVRIGITKEAERPLRFLEPGSPFVSGPRHLLRA
jgi:DNA-3-methyladenine glycosylase